MHVYICLCGQEAASSFDTMIRENGDCAPPTVARTMETDEIWSLRYCPRAPLGPYNVRPVSNGPIRRDATRHKVLLSDGFRETPTEVEVQNYTLLSRLPDFRFCRK